MDVRLGMSWQLSRTTCFAFSGQHCASGTMALLHLATLRHAQVTEGDVYTFDA